MPRQMPSTGLSAARNARSSFGSAASRRRFGSPQAGMRSCPQKVRLAAGGDALLSVEGRVHVAAARQQEAVAGQRLGHGGIRVGKRYPVYLGTGPGQTFHIF